MTSIVAHVDCHAELALLVAVCAETHPNHERHAWHSGRLHVHLDLSDIADASDRQCEAARVERWLEKVARGREPISWDTWAAREQANG